MSDEQQVWDLTDPGGTPVARVVPTPDAQGKVRVTLYPTAHSGREAHEPVVAAIREKLGELGIEDDSVVWSQEEWPL